MPFVLRLPWQRGCQNDINYDSRKSHKILRKWTKTIGVANRNMVGGTMCPGLYGLNFELSESILKQVIKHLFQTF